MPSSRALKINIEEIMSVKNPRMMGLHQAIGQAGCESGEVHVFISPTPYTLRRDGDRPAGAKNVVHLTGLKRDPRPRSSSNT